MRRAVSIGSVEVLPFPTGLYARGETGVRDLRATPRKIPLQVFATDPLPVTRAMARLASRLRFLPGPLGYHPLLEQSDVPAKSKRDLDICVLAAMTDRREEFIAANADFFAARNCHIRFVPIGFAKTEEARSSQGSAAGNECEQRAVERGDTQRPWNSRRSAGLGVTRSGTIAAKLRE